MLFSCQCMQPVANGSAIDDATGQSKDFAREYSVNRNLNPPNGVASTFLASSTHDTRRDGNDPFYNDAHYCVTASGDISAAVEAKCLLDLYQPS